MNSRRYHVFSDVFSVTAFSLGGMAFHEVSGETVAEFIRISLPFFVGMLSASWAMGCYEKIEDGAEYAKRNLFGLVLGLVLSFLFRGLQRGYMPQLSFFVASTVFFAVLSLLFRTVYWKFLRRKLS